MTTRTEVIKYLATCSSIEDILSDVRDYKFLELDVEFPDWLDQHNRNHIQFYKDMIVMLDDLGMSIPKNKSDKIDSSDEDGPNDEDDYDEDEDSYDLRHYRGRFFYDGPAVVCSYEMLSKVMAATSVSLKQDSMGYDVVVYPSY